MHLLIVDDDFTSRELLAGICKNAGHQVVLAENGQEAWDLLDDPKRWFDAVFLDVTMPKWGGFDVLKRIRESSLHRSLEIVMCTVSNDRGTITEAIRLGAKHYIVKPCTEDKVTARLKQIEENRLVAADRHAL